MPSGASSRASCIRRPSMRKSSSTNSLTAVPSALGTAAVSGRRNAEIEARKGVRIDGRRRRDQGDRVQVIFRMTLEKKRQLDRLAEGMDKSYSAIMSEALDVLDGKLRGR